MAKNIKNTDGTVGDLLNELGYEDPCPDKGRNNKEANKLRTEERSRTLARIGGLKDKKIGYTEEDEGGGWKSKAPVYKYNNKKYKG